MNTSDQRIAVLRRRCLERKSAAWRDVSVARAQALRGSERVVSWQERQGLCTREVLSQAAFEVDDLELLLGRLAPRPAAITADVLAKAQAFLEQYPRPGGQTGHCELDLGRVMAIGIDGVVEDLRARLSHAEGQRAATYRSFLSALAGLTRMIENAAACARHALAAGSAARRLELEPLIDICTAIAHRPPTSFRAAIQLLWLVILAVQHGESVALVGPGHLDRTLGPFYAADVAAGKLTRAEGLLLVESLYLLVNEFIPDGLAIPVMVGGRDASGRDVTNELSYLCLEALRRTRLVYPTVGVCWHAGTPPELVDLALELIANGCSTPAFFGDDTIQKGLKALGVPPEEACNYINSTCVEITPVGASNVWVASPYYNTCGLLLEELASQAASPPSSFEQFRAGYLERLRLAVAAGAKVQDELRREREQHGGKPLQSVFTRDCLVTGRDLDRGGATYNWVECSFVGLANLADSLYVIREEVFNLGRMTLGDLRAVLEADFSGYEPQRQRFLNAYPKYGQDHPAVDAFVAETVAFVRDVCGQLGVYPDNSPYVPGAFVWVMHELLGQETGATPDGRKAHTPLADGAGPAQGRECKGPTAAILSTTRWDHSRLIGGVAFNMKFNRSLFDSPESPDRLRDLVLAFLRRGGFETQINVVDMETLRKARENPEPYRDLVVRIGGYTDYFTRLSPEMQEEIMLRTEYGCV